MRTFYRLSLSILLLASLLTVTGLGAQPPLPRSEDVFREIIDLAKEGRTREARSAIDSWETDHPEDAERLGFARRLTDKAESETDPRKREEMVALELIRWTRGQFQELGEGLEKLNEIVSSRGPEIAVESAVVAGDIGALEAELAKGYSLSEHKGEIPLLNLAVAGGHNEMMRFLVERGAAVDSELFGGTPLMTASEKGNLEAVRFLLDHGAEPNRRDLKNRTPLYLARANKHVEIAKLLESRGGIVTDPKPLPERPGAKKQPATPNDALLDAASSGAIEKAKKLIEEGADVNYAGGTLSFRPISAAVSNGDLAMTKLLLANGAKPDFGENGPLLPPLAHAAQSGKHEIVTVLLEHGADPSREALLGNTPLILAAGGGHLEAVNALVEAGAGIDAMNAVQHTALMEAAKNGHLSIVELLLSKSAKVNIRNIGSKTALDLANDGGHTAIAKALKAAGARPGS